MPKFISDVQLVGSSTDLTLQDSGVIKLGTDNDLQIYHDGSNSYIDDTGTGNLLIRAGNLQLQRADGSQIYLVANTGSEVAIYYAGTKKFETTSAGTLTSGESEASRFIATNGNMLQFHKSSWNTGNTDHYVLYNAWTSSTGDYIFLKSSGNQSGNNGAILISDGNSGGRVYFGLHGNQQAAVDSATAPLATTYAYIGGSANYFSANTTITGTISNSQFTIPNTAGTAGQVLKWPSSGTTLEWADDSGGGGAVDGSGTANDIVMWSDSDTLTDAPIAISGNNATFAGDIYASGGSLGVGTISPAFRLHSYHPSTNVVARFESGDNQVWIDLHDDGSGTYGALLGHDSNANILFTVADSGVNRKFIIKDSGDVNITGSTEIKYVTSTDSSTFLTLHNDVGSDLTTQKTFIDFIFEDDNDNDWPQVRIGAIVGQNGDANTQLKEGSGAFVVYTNNATTNSPGSPSALNEKFRVDYRGYIGIGTSTPSGALHVYQSGSERLLVSGDVNVQGSTDLNVNGTSRRLNFTAGTGTVRTTTSNNLILQANSVTRQTLSTGGYSEEAGSYRAPIFYDSNDTTYYGNFNTGQVRLGVSNGFSAIETRGSGGYLSFRVTDNSHSDGWGWSFTNQDLSTTSWDTYLRVNYNATATSSSVIATGSFRAPIFYDSNDTTYYIDPAGTSQVNSIEFVGSTNNARIGQPVSTEWGTRITTDSGYILFGPANSSHAHIYTDRSNFYFNKQIQLLGGSLINQNDIRAQVFYDLNDTAYYVDPASTSNVKTVDFDGYIEASATGTRDKYRVWTSSAYAIGMKSGYDYGHLGSNEYAMSFQMNNNSGRGFWWGDDGHGDDQGAASLTTDGRLTVATSISVGEGESVTSPSSTTLYVNGSTVLNTTSDAQLTLTSSDTWTGIGFNDGAGTGTQYIWHRGATGTFAIGGGGSAVSGKKLHIDGGTTIGSSYDATSPPTDGLSVQGDIYTSTVQISNGTSYNENIRMFPSSSNDYSSLILGAVSGTSGTGTGQWTLVRFPASSSNKFTIRHSSSDHVEISTSGNVTNLVDTRSPIFYDSNDTNYFIDPRTATNGFKFYSAAGPIFLRGQTHWDSKPGIDLSGGTEEFRFSSTSGNLNLRTDGWLIAQDYIRSPLFYDHNDTTYYLDPASGNRFKGITEFRTSAGNARGYIQATDTNDEHFIIATSGGEDIAFKDGGVSGTTNMIIRGDGDVFTFGNNYGRIWYDYDNTAYYLNPAGQSQFSSILRENSRISTAQEYPLGHYTGGKEIWSLDPTWTDAELREYFGNSNVSWNADSTAPGGYAIYINGGVSVGGVYSSGFPYIPVEEDAIYYMECYIKNAGTDQRHYMGSNEYNESFSSLGGNPGSYGYWVMANTNPGSSWFKATGIIRGNSATATGYFENGTKYWTPMALFNYGAGSGTRACYISGWKVIKISSAEYFADGSTSTPSISFAEDRDTGIYRPNNNQLAFVVGTSRKVLIENNGVIVQNGIFESYNDIRSPIYYDRDNTGYYTNPAGDSQMNQIHLADYIRHLSDLNTYIGFPSNDNFVVHANGTDRLKIDATNVHAKDVYFKVSSGSSNTYGSSYLFHSIEASRANEPILMLHNTIPTTSSQHYGLNIVTAANHNNTTSRFMLGQGGSSEKIKIYSNGNIQNQNNSYGQLSDINIKENVVDATSKLDEINQVRVVNFNYIGDVDEETNIPNKQIGVIAQELEQIFPKMVYECGDTETPTKSVKYSVFVPMLIKAVQELKADNDSLRARIETLENS